MRYPGLGFGVGLRVQHYEALMSPQPAVEWLEVLTENFMVDGGRPLQKLARLPRTLSAGDAWGVAVDRKR